MQNYSYNVKDKPRNILHINADKSRSIITFLAYPVGLY